MAGGARGDGGVRQGARESPWFSGRRRPHLTCRGNMVRLAGAAGRARSVLVVARNSLHVIAKRALGG